MGRIYSIASAEINCSVISVSVVLLFAESSLLKPLANLTMNQMRNKPAFTHCRIRYVSRCNFLLAKRTISITSSMVQMTEMMRAKTMSGTSAPLLSTRYVCAGDEEYEYHEEEL